MTSHPKSPGRSPGRIGPPVEAGDPQRFIPRMIAWELTRACPLACTHCRAEAQATAASDELTTDECFRLIDNIVSFARPVLILTGGEPLLRPDLYDIAARANERGLRTVAATCGTLLDDESAQRMLRSGIRRISVSLDGATAASHDAFRGVAGAFAGALRGLETARRCGLEYQINTTVTRHNLEELEAICELAIRLGAVAFNPFLLVPTGRGRDLIDQEISPGQYERTLRWLAQRQQRGDIEIRVTCAPHYQRIVRQMKLGPLPAGSPKGCMGGQSFAFVSHVGKVQICGFLDLDCGDLRREGLDFRKIWQTSPVFQRVRDRRSYGGRCGQCEYWGVCGGCRARAYAITGDYLAEEPFCLYQPRPDDPPSASPRPLTDPFDKAVLSAIQTDFPVARRPFDELADRLDSQADHLLECVARLRQGGFIRRIGAVFDSRRLGYASCLVAARVPAARLDEVVALVNGLPGVTHNYRRQHAYNLWFTLTARSRAELEELVGDLRLRTGIAEFFLLPALAVYKIQAVFHPDTPRAADRPAAPISAGPAELDEQDKRLVRVLQEDLPICQTPFDAVAERLECTVEEVLGRIEQWLATGVIRRLGAVVRHRRLGFEANGMAVFDVPADRLDKAGRQIARCPQVSHCYHRPPLPDFPYNLFAMFHGRDPGQVRAVVADIAGQLGRIAFDVLFSTREYKKTSMQYFSEPTPCGRPEGLPPPDGPAGRDAAPVDGDVPGS